LTVIFWPLATVRVFAPPLPVVWVLVVSVVWVVWAKAAEANASMTVRAMVDTRNLFDWFTLIVFLSPAYLSYKI
jgi:lipase chaperone LimK